MIRLNRENRGAQSCPRQPVIAVPECINSGTTRDPHAPIPRRIIALTTEQRVSERFVENPILREGHSGAIARTANNRRLIHGQRTNLRIGP